MAGNSGTRRRPIRKEPRDLGGTTPTRDACDIRLATSLAHVRTAQTEKLRVGNFLSVSVEQVTKTRTVVCKSKRTQEIVGFVLARGASTLIDCIDQGNLYEAEIVSMDFALVEVQIRRVA